MGLYSALAAALLLGLLMSSRALAQSISVNAVTANTPSFGNVAAGATGSTVFRISTSAAVSKISGSGGTRSSGTRTRATVTIRCTGGNNCNSAVANVKLAPVASNSGRGLGVSHFTAISGTGTVSNVVANGDGTLSLQLSGFNRNSNRTFYVGLDMTVAGDNASLATSATSAWTVAAALAPAMPATLGTTVNARIPGIARAISMTNVAPLRFGAVRAPSSGSGTVSIPATNDVRTSGGGSPPVLVPGLASGRAEFTITGQASTAISLSMPATVTMTSGASSLSVALSRDPSGATSLDGSGSRTVFVGGTMTVPAGTASGDYSGSFTLTAAYN